MWCDVVVVVVAVVVVLSLSSTWQWSWSGGWRRGCVRRASQAGGSRHIVELAWPKRAVTKAFNDASGDEEEGGGGKEVEL